MTELEYVETPFLNQLASMGWKLITGSDEAPTSGGGVDQLGAPVYRKFMHSCRTAGCDVRAHC